jgi:hypothetical protein
MHRAATLTHIAPGNNMTSTRRPFRPYAPPSTKWRTRWLLVAALILVGVVLTACDVHGVSEPGTLASITVTPNATLAASTTQQMVAVGHDAEGRRVEISPSWSVANSGGTVNAAGLFTAGSLTGIFANTVRATVGGISGSASIAVIAGPLASISIVPNPVTLAVMAGQQFVAVGKDAGGNIVQFTPTWTIVAGGGTIAQTGLFTANAATGTYTNTVQASSLGVTAFATVIVTAGPLASITLTPSPATMIVGAVQQFTAVGKDAAGNVVTAAFTWSLAAGGGTLDAAGRFTAGSTPGTFTNTVRVASGTLSASATVIVTAGPLTTITVTPNPATMTIGGTQQFTAVGSDAGGNPIVISPVWDVVANGGTITSTGLFTAGTVSGTFANTVRATSGTMTGTATVIVTSGPLATITVTPNPVSMPTNSTQQFVAVGRDANNNVFLMTPVWSIVNFGGTITSGGLFTAGNTPGVFANTVQATSGSISGTATVTVTAVVPPPPPPPGPHPLGAAAPFGVLAGAGINCAISGPINGSSANIGSSPTNTITGFGPCTFTGSIPLPAIVATAKADLTAAYLAAQGQVCNPLPFPAGNNLSGIDLGFFGPGNPLPAGTYCFNTSAAITGTLQLTGPAAAVWTFQIGSTFNTAVGAQVLMAGGAIPDNVYWAVGSSATLGSNSVTRGNIMALASITLNNSAVLLGRALAQNGAVDMIAGAAVITKP